MTTERNYESRWTLSFSAGWKILWFFSIVDSHLSPNFTDFSSFWFSFEKLWIPTKSHSKFLLFQKDFVMVHKFHVFNEFMHAINSTVSILLNIFYSSLLRSLLNAEARLRWFFFLGFLRFFERQDIFLHPLTTLGVSIWESCYVEDSRYKLTSLPPLTQKIWHKRKENHWKEDEKL